MVWNTIVFEDMRRNYILISLFYNLILEYHMCVRTRIRMVCIWMN